MTILRRIVFACNVTLAAALATSLACCNQDPAIIPSRDQMTATPKTEPVSPSPKMTPAEIEALWIRRIAALNESDPKARFGSESVAFQSVLREDCSQPDRDELLDYAANAPGGNNKAGFPRVAVAGLVAYYAETGDRASLVSVLEKASPHKVGLRDVEDYVVLSSRGISDPITVLFDAFAQSQSESAKAAIADGLRRGFAFAGTLPDDDVELVAWCKKWHEDNRNTYVANSEYSQNSAMGLTSGRYRSNGLFVPKNP